MNEIIATDLSIKDLIRLYAQEQRLDDLNFINVSGVTTMAELFVNIDYSPDISKWDVSQVRDMCRMFAYSQFNSDISKWNVCNVKNMFNMFGNSQFNQDISLWDVSNVENMGGMFSHSKFNRDISSWNTKKVQLMAHMFHSSDFFQNLCNWDVSACTHSKGFNFDSELPIEYLPVSFCISPFDPNEYQMDDMRHLNELLGHLRRGYIENVENNQRENHVVYEIINDGIINKSLLLENVIDNEINSDLLRNLGWVLV